MSVHYKSFTETFDDEKGHEYHFLVVCSRDSSHIKRITVKGEDLFRYNNGAKAQEAFPYLSSADRELLCLTGMCSTCWDELFAPDEEEAD